MKKIIVVTNPKSFKLDISNVEVISERDYLTRPELADLKNIRLFNLCNEYKYQSRGYYVSLLAEARGHKPIPNIKNIQDLKAPAMVKVISDELDDLFQKTFKNIKSREYILSIYFGKNVAKQYDKLSQELHQLFQAPFLRARFIFNKKWTLSSVRPITFSEIPEYHLEYVRQFAAEYFGKKRFSTAAKPTKYLYDLAILFDSDEQAPPSDPKSLLKFEEAAEKLGFYTERITKKDFNRLAEFDALFIRTTTNVNQYSYRFSRKAQSEGMAVIDDPDSILKCTNKVYLTEILANAKIAIPKTIIVHEDNKETLAASLGLPCVLKLPDSSFSLGVKKVNTKEELTEHLNKMLHESDLVIAQEFIPTEFDWRIGFIDGNPIYACKYYMARGHWQIINWDSKNKKSMHGASQGVPMDEVPPHVLKTAKKAVKLIGAGLYGVDIKEMNGKAYIIEINDNPSIDLGVEDEILKDDLYKIIMQSLKNRIEESLNIHKEQPNVPAI